MAGLLPASVYGLKVPAGDIMIPAAIEFPASFRITMAAIDPSADPQFDEDHKVPRATLKLIRDRRNQDDDEDYDDEDDEDFDDIEAIKARLAGVISDEDLSDSEEDSEDEKNGGPSDPVKAKKAKEAALTKKLQEELDAEAMELDNVPNGVNGSKAKGKGKALYAGESSEEDSDDELDEDEAETFVVCTLDPEKNYQQPLDITVAEGELIYFTSSGTHDIYLTGNYVFPADFSDSEEDEEDDEEDYDLDYDIAPAESDEEDISEDEEDELDGLPDPRVMEVDSDEEEAPKLIKADKKGKNKRPADDSEDDNAAATLEALIAKDKAAAPATNGEQKLSKKQAKKLKKNDGQAVLAAQEETPGKKDQKETPGSDKKDKKVQFAKNLEQGPTPSPKDAQKKETQKAGPRTVNDVIIDDKKIGTGRPAKKGDAIGMRYIGKFKDGKQFDANKKGKPFTFTLGKGEVIKGWDIGVEGIKAGGERRITVPAKHGYGSKGVPGIPGNATLIFDVKCISVG